MSTEDCRSAEAILAGRRAHRRRALRRHHRLGPGLYCPRHRQRRRRRTLAGPVPSRGLLVALRHLGIPEAAGVCALTLLLCALVPHEPVPIPGRINVRAAVTSVLPILPALAVMASIAAIGAREAVSARGRGGVLALALPINAALLAVTSLLALPLGVPTFARNAVILTGLSVAASTWCGARAGGVLVVLYVCANWLLGVDMLNQARWWAWIMAPPQRASAWAGALLVLIIAAASLAQGPPRRAASG